MSFSIDLPVPAMTKSLREFHRRQIPFATSLAINATLADARDELRKQLPRTFTIRNKFLQQGIRTRRSTKKKLSGAVFTVDAILQRQIEGGLKETRGHRIPLARDVRASARGIIRKGNRPQALRNKPRHFVQGFGESTGGGARSDRGDVGVFRRKTKRRYPIVLLWRLDTGPVRIQAAFDFHEIAVRVFRRQWERNFGKALARAIATAKP